MFRATDAPAEGIRKRFVLQGLAAALERNGCAWQPVCKKQQHKPAASARPKPPYGRFRGHMKSLGGHAGLGVTARIRYGWQNQNLVLRQIWMVDLIVGPTAEHPCAAENTHEGPMHSIGPSLRSYSNYGLIIQAHHAYGAIRRPSYAVRYTPFLSWGEHHREAVDTEARSREASYL